MGEVPDWYRTIRAAKYLGVAPWELMDQPVVWESWARVSENAEAEANRQRQEAQKRKSNH